MTQLCDYRALPHGAQGDFTPPRKGHTTGFTTHHTGKTGITTVNPAFFGRRTSFCRQQFLIVLGHTAGPYSSPTGGMPNNQKLLRIQHLPPRLFFTASLPPLRGAGHTCLGHYSRKLQHVMANPLHIHKHNNHL